MSRASIAELSGNKYNLIIVGLVISKTAPKTVSKWDGSKRSVLNFTMRDSPSDTINVTCWGEENPVRSLSETFAIGDVVEIHNPQVIPKHLTKTDDRFHPEVSSPFHLNLNPEHCKVKICRHMEPELKSLSCLPPKLNDLHCSLQDIIHNGQNMDGGRVNVLVAVRSVGIPQEILTKDGRRTKKLDVQVFDQDIHCFNVTLWNAEEIEMAQKSFEPRSLLFITNLKMQFNKFTSEIEGTTDGKTIFTINPSVSEACMLQQHAMAANFEEITYDDGNISNQVSRITNILTVVELMDVCELSEGLVEGVIFAYISHIDLDGLHSLTYYSCSRCQRFTSNQHCENLDCPVGIGQAQMEVEERFNIRVNITDHTATLTACTLRDTTAQDVLGCTAKEFFAMTNDEKTALKWKFLLERYKIVVQANIPVELQEGRPYFKILSCIPANPNVFAKAFQFKK